MMPFGKHIVFGSFEHAVLGRCIGLNLFTSAEPICQYDCAFCQLNKAGHASAVAPEPYEVVEQLIEFLQIKGGPTTPIDCIVITGGGDPTIHPKFAEIIKDVILVRDLISTETTIGVFTNGQGLHRPDVVESLHRVDLCVLKVDPSQESSTREQLVDVEMASNIADLSAVRTKLILQSCIVEQDAENKTHSGNWDQEVESIRQFNPKKAFLCSAQKDVESSSIPFLPFEQLEQVKNRLLAENIRTFIL